MANPLSSVARTVGKAFSGVFYNATLVRDVPGAGPAYDPGPPTPTDYSCKALVEAYSDYYRSNGLVTIKDRKVLILATSLSTKPQLNDRVTVQGITFVLSDSIEIDPALAVWVCKGAMV